ncbi:NLRP3 protein, partial [Polypterus senegalus]|nr:NLRP3 protein [Polypterus senegalus]
MPELFTTCPGHVRACRERFQVVGPSSDVRAFVGEDVILPASLSPAINAEAFQLSWFQDAFDSPVLLYQNLKITPERQMQAYKGRTALFREELLNGNVSLRLQDVRLSDRGLYRCFVDSGPWRDEVHIALNIEVLGGQPYISISSTEDKQTRLECMSDKWGTTPDVTWRDMNGVDLTPESSVTEVRDNEGFLRVRSFIPIKQEFNVFSCLMRSKVPKPDWHSRLTVYVFSPGVLSWMVVFWLSLLLYVALAALLIFKWRRMRGRKERYESKGKKLLEEIDTRNEPPVFDPRARDLHETHRQAMCESTRTLEVQGSHGYPYTTAVSCETRYTELVAIIQDSKNHKETEHELMKTGRFHEELMEKGAAEKCERIWIEQLFRKSPASVNPVNIIVVSGMVGIGKTTMVQKIMYDWARGTQYQRFAFVFLFKFRELNLIDNENDPQMSLTKLIEKYYKYFSNDQLKDVLKNPKSLLFIFDGLEEYKHKLDFTQSQLCSNQDVEVPVHILVTSLVSRTLLKGCSVLITSRPTALEAMDMERVDRFVEILGFFPEQRLMYCKKFFGDTALAAESFQYVKENTILYSMCFSPSYCWMICSALKCHFMTPETAKSEAVQVGQWLCETQNKELIRDCIGEDLEMDFRSTTLSAVDCAVLATVISCCGELKQLVLSETPLTPECIMRLEPGISCCSVVW